MSKICFEFGSFTLDPARRILSRDAEPVPLTPRAFELLSALVLSGGRTLTKDCLIRAVWKESVVDERNFHVTLHTVRRALGESGRAPNYIVKTPDGYRFTADVRQRGEIDETESPAAGDISKSTIAKPAGREQSNQVLGRRTYPFGKHIAHVIVSCSLYAGLYAAAVLLEVAYKFERFGTRALKIAPVVFVGVLITSAAGLLLDHRMALRGKVAGLWLASLTFLLSAGLLFAALCLFLPPDPITLSNLQSYSAQAAYLKDESYFLVLAIFFMIVPLHFITRMERQIAADRGTATLGLPIEKRHTVNKSIAHPSVWVLTTLLVTLALVSVAMTAHLVDNLIPGPYMNLFVLLVYLRGILYFGLGVECLIWYWTTLNELSREH